MMKSTVFILVAAVFQLVSSAEQHSGGCGRSDIHGIINDDKLFYVETNFKANFFQAYEYCRSIGLHLSTIYSSKEEAAIYNYVKGIGFLNENYWTSGNDLGKNNTYNWMSTGEPIIYRNFRSGEPSHFTQIERAEEHCIVLELNTRTTWNDLSCEKENYFICEMNHCNNV